jgi:hypothetical protein
MLMFMEFATSVHMIAFCSYLHCNVLKYCIKYIYQRVLGVTAAILHIQGYLRSAQSRVVIRNELFRIRLRIRNKLFRIRLRIRLRLSVWYGSTMIRQRRHSYLSVTILCFCTLRLFRASFWKKRFLFI